MRFQDDLITRFHQIFAFILTSSGSENNIFIKKKNNFKWYCLAIKTIRND